MFHSGLFSNHRFNETISTTPVSRDYRIGWIDHHNGNKDTALQSKSNILIIGDSIVSGLTRYKDIWYKYFGKNHALNFGIPGDHIENVLWRLIDLTLPDTVKYVIVHAGSNNVDKNSPKDIANGILISGHILLEKNPNLKVILSGILPRNQIGSSIREKIEIVNQILFNSCYNNSNLFFFITWK